PESAIYNHKFSRKSDPSPRLRHIPPLFQRCEQGVGMARYRNPNYRHGVLGAAMDRKMRMLLPWLEDAEAIANLLGHLPTQGESVKQQRILLSNSRASLQSRPKYEAPTQVIRELPAEIQQLGAAFCGRPETVSALQGLDWSTGMVDLRHVLSFQKMIAE